MRLIFTIILLLTTIISNAQKPVVGKSYIRYDGSDGTEKLSNYYRTTTQNKNETFHVEEFYRFTTPPQLRKVYTINSEGNKEGVYEKYDRDKVLIHNGNYDQGKREGIWSFYRSGRLHHITQYTNGKKNGLVKYYFKNKHIYSWKWKNGKNDGFNTSRYSDGSLKFDGIYIEGKLKGDVTRYYKGGNIKSKEIYKLGKLEGVCQNFYNSGVIKSKGNFLNGKRIGTWEWYREDGSIASREEYDQIGKLKELLFFDKDGKQEIKPVEDVFEGVIDDDDEFKKIIQELISTSSSYPRGMLAKGFESLVKVKFIINNQGLPDKIKVESDGPLIFETEARIVISRLPKQTPGRAHNLELDVNYNITIDYRL